MRALIVVASRHGATGEIACAIADELSADEISTDVMNADEVASIAGYDAVIIGSAVYMGKWLPEARRFVEDHQRWLASLPVWLFSSGPLGADDPKPAGEPAQIPDLVAAAHAREHRVFAGRLDHSELGLGERIIASVVHAPDGDFRDWHAIRQWAWEIAACLVEAERLVGDTRTGSAPVREA